MDLDLDLDLDFILGTSELPAAVPSSPGIRIEDLDAKLWALAALAPGVSYGQYHTVLARYHRTSISRVRFERSLEVGKQLKMQEYDREAAVRTIDGQWLDLRKQRNTVMVADRRKR